MIMDINISMDNALLVGSILLFLCVIASKTGYKLGVPILLLFLFVGMIFGSDGLGITFDNPQYAQFIGVIALSVILFSGGMETKIDDVKPIWKRGLILSTFGVAMTAGFVGMFIYYISNIFGVKMAMSESLLLGCVMSSTDSASVFSLMRSQGLNISGRLRSLLEFESGSNDPMAYILTIFLIQLCTMGSFVWHQVIIMFTMQIALGLFIGYLMGIVSVFTLNRMNIMNEAFYFVMVIAFVFFTFSFTDKFGGNGYLAVYLAGLVVGNKNFVHKKKTIKFFESFAWIWQIVMFLALGLLVNPKELLSVSVIGIMIAIFMSFFARPITVFISLLYSKMPFNEKIYISWIGLKGAVPIIFATYPMIAGIPNAKEIFNIVFFITIFSLLFQGMTVVSVARFLGLIREEKSHKSYFNLEMAEELKKVFYEMEIKDGMLIDGNELMNVKFPRNTLVVMVRRGDEYFVPKGKTQFKAGDKILLISDSDDEVKSFCDNAKLDAYKIKS